MQQVLQVSMQVIPLTELAILVEQPMLMLIASVVVLVVFGLFLVLLVKTGSGPEVGEPEPKLTGLAARFAATLGASRAALQGRFDTLFNKPFNSEVLDDLEDALLQADVGIQTVQKLRKTIEAEAATNDDPAHLRQVLKNEIQQMLQSVAEPLKEINKKPWVVLVVGVNGSGKTTTIGKLADRWGKEGKKVLVAAADTYRAAAAEQLEIWAERAGASIVRHNEGADPGAVVYEALDVARSTDCDLVLIDTAGRLQTRKPLMDQLSKLNRVIQKTVPDGPHETLLVLDGTMGQNGLSQAKLFNEATPLTGVAVTKLDGTAKGGMILTICSELGLPVKLVGIGEKIDDLKDFEVDAFIEVLA